MKKAEPMATTIALSKVLILIIVVQGVATLGTYAFGDKFPLASIDLVSWTIMLMLIRVSYQLESQTEILQQKARPKSES